MAQNGRVTLNCGIVMPTFGLGTWVAKQSELTTRGSVETAIKSGYRLIDCAHRYANEAEIGEALQKCFKEGVVKREEIFVISKLWVECQAYEDVLPACQVTLKDLQLDYLDLFLVHWPTRIEKGSGREVAKWTDQQRLGYSAEKMAKTWEAMEELLRKGFVKAIGISNFTITKTENLLKTAKIVPAINQVECHPYLQQQKLKEYCDSKGIILMAYAPLGSPYSNTCKGIPWVIHEPVIKDIADKHKVTVAQVCISYALHRGMVAIPKSASSVRIRENIKSTELKLDADDMKRIRELDRSLRYIKGAFFLRTEWDTNEYLWDTTKDRMFELEPLNCKV